MGLGGALELAEPERATRVPHDLSTTDRSRDGRIRRDRTIERRRFLFVLLVASVTGEGG
jgi:hypothetical protein